MASNSWVLEYGSKAPLQSPSSTYFSLFPAGPGLGRMLGYTWTIGGNTYKLVQAGAAFTAAQIQGLICADSGINAKNHIVTAVAGATVTGDLLAGIASATQLALNLNDFFVVQVAGRTTGTISGGSTVHVAQTTGATGRMIDMVAPAALANVPAALTQNIGTVHITLANSSVGELDINPAAFA